MQNKIPEGKDKCSENKQWWEFHIYKLAIHGD